MGYKFQFITLAGFHSMNPAIFELSSDFLRHGMLAYAELQERGLMREKKAIEPLNINLSLELVILMK